LQFAGLRYALSDGGTLVYAEFEEDGVWVPISPGDEATILIAAAGFLRNGGDGYSMLKGAKPAEEYGQHRGTSLLSEYVASDEVEVSPTMQILANRCTQNVAFEGLQRGCNIVITSQSEPEPIISGICRPGEYLLASRCAECPPGTSSLGGFSGVCIRCGAGTYQPQAAQGFCLACPEDTWRNHDQDATQCEPCPEGMYRKSTGEGCERCTSTDSGKCLCLEGEWVANGTEMQCQLCGVGYVRPENQVECSACPAGTFSNSTGGVECQRCPVGKYAAQEGSSSCTDCAAGRTTHDSAANSEMSCKCSSGHYSNELDGGNCHRCPDEVLGLQLCVRDDGFPDHCCTGLDRSVPRQPPGYYMRQTETGWDMYKCISPVSCIQSADPTVQRCAANFNEDSIACAQCKSGFHQVKFVCHDCSESGSAFPFVAALVVAFLLLIVIYYKLNSPVVEDASPFLEMSVALAMLLTATQSLSVMAQLSVVWESPLSDIMEAMKIFAFDVELLNFECVWSPEPTSRYYFRLAIPVVAILVLLGLYYLSRFLCMLSRGKIAPWLLTKTCNTIGQIFQAVYIGIILVAMLPFQCYAHPMGKSSMRKFPDVICGEGVHGGMFITAIFGTLIYGVGFYCICAFVALRAPHRSLVTSGKFNQYFRFLLANFRSDTWWWGIILLTRSFLIALVPILDADSGHIQLVLLTAILSVFLVAQSYYQPWKSAVLNWADTSVCLMLLLMASVSGVFAKAEVLDKSWFTTMMCLVLVTAGLIVLAVLGRALMAGVFGKNIPLPCIVPGESHDKVAVMIYDMARRLRPVQLNEITSITKEFGQFDRRIAMQFLTLMAVSFADDGPQIIGADGESINVSSQRLSTVSMRRSTLELEGVPMSKNSDVAWIPGTRIETNSMAQKMSREAPPPPSLAGNLRRLSTGGESSAPELSFERRQSSGEVSRRPKRSSSIGLTIPEEAEL